MECAKILHDERNYFHILETYKDGCFVPLLPNHAVLALSHQKVCSSAQCRNIICIDQHDSPKNQKKYALKVLSTLFSEEQLMNGMIAPINAKGSKVELDPERVEILKKCLRKKYGEKLIEKMCKEIPTSCNQKGCDLLKKKVKN